jgi:hypothetical protein
MNPLDDLLDEKDAHADDGLAPMTELVAAVTWLRRGAMPGLTVWDAIEQALRWRSGTDADWREPDPLRAALQIAIVNPEALSDVLAEAIRSWVIAMRSAFNEDRGFDL